MTVALFQNISRLHGGKPFFGKNKEKQGIFGSSWLYTAQKMKFSIKNFFSKCDQIRSFLVQNI